MVQAKRYRTMDLAYDGDGISLRCVFEAIHPLFGFGASADGC